MDERLFVIDDSDSGVRADVFLAENLEITRSHVKMLYAQGNVRLNSLPLDKCGRALKRGDVLTVCLPEPKQLSLTPENIPLNIVYEDDCLAVIDKQKNLVVHPAPGNESGTMVNALLYHLKSLSTINGVIRPGIVHRLDKDTTGLIVVAKNNEAHLSLSAQIADKTCKRIYVALLNGNLQRDEGTIDAPIARMKTDRKKMTVDPNGRAAVTDYTVLKRYNGYTLVRFSLRAGRTHQLRVHAKYIGHSVVGDPLYCGLKNKFGVTTQMLHATELHFNHPLTGEYMEFKSPLPQYFSEILAEIE